MDTSKLDMTTKKIVKDLASQLSSELVSIRRHLHKHPELSFEEVNTSAYIRSMLDQWKIPYTTGWAGHGIIATIDVGHQKTIALRADMDALPIKETSSHEYVSTTDGRMHACGHDVHMTCLLGAAFILTSMKEHLPHNIALFFQPGEEKLPGGAGMMIKEGALTSTNPEYIIGQHVFPSLEVGKVGVRSGLYMASADEIYLTVKGRGGHAAMPHENIDTILIASAIIVALQSIAARSSNPTMPTVLSFGKINSVGGATNVVPDIVKIEGTFRTLDEEWRAQVHKLIERIAQETAQAYGGSCEVDIQKGYPCLINDAHVTQTVKDRMIDFLGSENVVDLPIRMTSEDFAFYTQVIPGCFYRLGTGNKAKGITTPVHTSTFDIDESALELGAGLMAWLALGSD
jgi:amidohydrolase